MKFFIEDKILHSVKLSNAGYSATNQGKINTYNLLKEYAPLKKRINLIDTLPKQMITLAGLSDKIEEVEQIQDLIESVMSKNLQLTYRIKDSLMSSEEYYLAREICNIIEKAIEYLEVNDEYGADLIRNIFTIQFTKYDVSNKARKDMLMELLKRDVTTEMENVTYNNYKKYAIYRIDEYLFSEKNRKVHYLNGYVFDHESIKKNKAIEVKNKAREIDKTKIQTRPASYDDSRAIWILKNFETLKNDFVLSYHTMLRISEKDKLNKTDKRKLNESYFILEAYKECVYLISQLCLLNVGKGSYTNVCDYEKFALELYRNNEQDDKRKSTTLNYPSTSMIRYRKAVVLSMEQHLNEYPTVYKNLEKYMRSIA